MIKMAVKVRKGVDPGFILSLSRLCVIFSDFCVVYFLGFYLDNWKMTMDVLAELLRISEHLLKGYAEL